MSATLAGLTIIFLSLKMLLFVLDAVLFFRIIDFMRFEW